MTQLRLLASSLFASGLIACTPVLTAAAQSPSTPNPAPLTATIAGPSLLTLDATSPSTTTTFSLPPVAPGTFTLKALKPSPSTTLSNGKSFKVSNAHTNPHDPLVARTTEPCLMLRTYNFTAHDLKSDHPHPSSETDCTPASKGHFLSSLPANRNPRPHPAQNLQLQAVPK